MKRTVFYSWQSDLPNPTNRGFIQGALEGAAKTIADDDSVAVEPVVDRDTSGVPGSPDIAATIFSKISAADVVVVDISIINSSQAGRPTPNPNVLIELGYALKSLGHERVILVFNKAYGTMTDLPFDLRARRLVVYNMPEETKDRSSERRKLQKTIEVAIRSALTSVPAPDGNSLSLAIEAIENSKPNRVIVLRRDLDLLLKKITELEPKKHSDGGTADELLIAIDSTQEIVMGFSRVAETVSVMNDRECALEILRWMGNIFEKYNLPYGFSGSYSRADFDYFRFVGHELFTTLTAFLLREQKWDLLKNVLDEPIPVKSLQGKNGPANVGCEYASEHMYLLEEESRKRQRISIHADRLHERHSGGVLSAILSFEDFINADFFLYLLSQFSIEKEASRLGRWYPRSIVYLKHTPLFIRNAESIHAAEQLAKIFKVPDRTKLKDEIKKMVANLSRDFNPSMFLGSPIDMSDIEKIGSR